MPRVPFNPEEKPYSPLSPTPPSPENLLMAAAIMHGQGKFQVAENLPESKSPSIVPKTLGIVRIPRGQVGSIQPAGGTTYSGGRLSGGKPGEPLR